LAQPVLEVRNLSVAFDTPDGRVEAVKTLSFEVAPGECLGLVGESGSGKSQTVLAVMGLTAANGEVGGEMTFDGQDLKALSRKQFNEIRGARIAMIFQDPLTSLTPHMTVGAQMEEVLARHRKIRGAAAEKRIVEWLERVRIPEARRRLHQFPHELSGGMRQRVMIASAMLCEPALLLADEPTTALDVTVQAQVLDLMDELKRETKAGLVLITHDMGVIARMADRVVVMRYGEAVERGPVDQVFASPKHDYTRMLLDAMPRLDRADRGSRPTIAAPPPTEVKPLLEVDDIHVTFPVQVPGGLFGHSVPLRAVDGVSLSLRPGETLGVVGESGCGKSTLARGVLRLLDPSAGSVAWLGRNIADASRREMQPLRQELQIVFQDPLASLDPRMTLGGSIAEPLLAFEPLLTRDHGKVMPVRAGDLIAPNSKLLASPWEFEKHGQAGLEISELFSEVAQCADDLCVVRSMTSNVSVGVAPNATRRDPVERYTVRPIASCGLGQPSDNAASRSMTMPIAPVCPSPAPRAGATAGSGARRRGCRSRGCAGLGPGRTSQA
jgi:ABC-type microcin C transport system duplicated ATPase subunit YejF